MNITWENIAPHAIEFANGLAPLASWFYGVLFVVLAVNFAFYLRRLRKDARAGSGASGGGVVSVAQQAAEHPASSAAGKKLGRSALGPIAPSVGSTGYSGSGSVKSGGGSDGGSSGGDVARDRALAPLATKGPYGEWLDRTGERWTP